MRAWDYRRSRRRSGWRRKCWRPARTPPPPAGWTSTSTCERLIIEDTTGARAAGMAAAQRLIDNHGDFLDELEQQLDAPDRLAAPGAAA